MNLSIEIERVNDISFNHNSGTIDLQVRDFETNSILDQLSLESILEFLTDEQIKEEFENRRLKIG